MDFDEIVPVILFSAVPPLLIFWCFFWHKVIKRFRIRPLDQLLQGEKHIMTERSSKFWLILDLCFWCFVHFLAMYAWSSGGVFFLVYILCCLPLYILLHIPASIKAYLQGFIMVTDRRVVGMGRNCLINISVREKRRATNSSLDIPLDKVDSMFVEMDLFAKFVGTGNIILNSGAQTYSFYGFQMPERFKNTVMEQVDLKKKEAAELQMQQQAELAQEQRADAERLAQFQAQAMAQAMLEAQGIAVPPQPQYQMPQNPHGQFQMPQNQVQMPMMEIPVGGGVQIPVTPQQMQAQIPQEQYHMPPQQTQIPPPVEPSQYVGQRQLAVEHCVACQNELSPNAKFCPACGSPQ